MPVDPAALGPAGGGGGSRPPERGRRVLAQLTGELYRTSSDPKQCTDAQRAWLPGTATAAVVAAGARARQERQLAQGGGCTDSDGDPASATSLRLPSEAAEGAPAGAAGRVTVPIAATTAPTPGATYAYAHGRFAAFQAPPKPSRHLRPARGVFADE